MKNFYEMLGLEPTASIEEIAAKIEKLRSKYNTILETGSAKKRIKAQEDLDQLNEAESILLNKEQRDKYDEYLRLKASKEKDSDNQEPNTSTETTEASSNTDNDEDVEESYKPVPIDVPDIPIESYAVNRPEFYFTNDVDKLWELYTQYLKNGEEDNKRYCFRKLTILHSKDPRVNKELEHYNYSEKRFKYLGWAGFIIMSFIWFILVFTLLAGLSSRR